MVLHMELKDFRMTLDLLPTLFKMLDADEEWVKSLTEDQKQEIVDKVNRIVAERNRQHWHVRWEQSGHSV